MDNLNPPFVLIESNVVGLNESVRLDSLFAVTDADASSGITEYQIRDNGEGGGFFTQGGNRLTPSFGEFIVVPGNLISTVQYVGGSSIATESISIRAFDGTFFSNQATGFITSGNSRPVLTANDIVVTAGSRTSIADWVQYSDAENNPDLLYFVVDRSIGINGGQLIESQDDIANPQATFLLTTGFELAGTTYQAPSVGGESETLSIRAFDGFSWSETVDFTVTTSISPAIIDNGVQEVISNQRIAATDLFSLDAIGESISPTETFFFVDRRTNAGGGFFEFQGEQQASGQFFKVQADELDQLFYVGASLGNDIENIGIVGFNGLELGEVQDIAIQTLPSPTIANNPIVRAGHFLNIATGGTANISGTVPAGDTPIFDFLDSGANVIEYLFADRSTSGGHFVFRGAQVPSAQFFRVPADELDQLEYVGAQTGPTSEDIGILVNTNFVWTTLDDFTIDTIPNANAPVVTFPSITARSGSSLPLESLFGFTDADGDNLQSVTFLDTDADASTGFFTINGVQQAAETSIVVPFDEIGTVNYVTASSANSEEIQITVNDGLLDSNVGVATISSIGLPTIAANASDISVGTIQRVNVSSIITQTDSGPTLTRYQVFDENLDSRSGRFELDGVDLQNGIVHDLTADQYSRLVFKGAEVDLGRQLDPIIVRGNNGTDGWTEWERINVNTDPVGSTALNTGLQILDKDLSTPTNVITYTFIDGGDQGGTVGNGGLQVPAYYDPLLSNEGLADGGGLARGFSQEQREAFREAFAFYESVIDVEFVETAYTTATTAEIVIGAYNFTPFGSTLSSFTYIPSTGDGRGNLDSDIWFNTANLDFNPDTPTNVSLGSVYRGDDIYGSIGFALGLGNPSAAAVPLSIFNNFDYLSIMSQQHDSIHNQFAPFPEESSSLALYDVQELQTIYGANADFNTGDNQYGNFFSGSAPHFIDNNQTHQTTLWDGGGTDTLNYTLHVANETIDLREGTWSSINGVPQALRIAYGTTIENARGGSGNDNIRGNEVANFLFGNEGNDVLRGGGDNDVLRGGAGNDTYVWTLGDGRDFVQELAAGGLDTLQVFDSSGAITSLEDDFTFRRFGNDLRIDFTFNQGSGQGTVTIDDFGDEASRVEFLTLHNAAGTQIGSAVDLQSIFDQATTLAQQFEVGTELATTLPVADGATDQNAFAALAVS